ncbi:UNVERIFIED_CONTAM: hypothetical protein GTU68_023375 [Idotea baltica]|nr:hypothetical protein [Idotea baltica]
MIKTPRAIVLMVPAGQPVDDQIDALRALMDEDDLIIDAGNAKFQDTNRRVHDNKGPFLGIGVSGGEEGARFGPSIMGGGKREYWDRVAHILEVFERWNDGPLQSYLIEISGKVAEAVDPKANKPVLDIIVDAAGQKGTGRWTAVESQHLASPVPAIEAAVVARNLSARRNERAEGEDVFGAAPTKIPSDVLSLDDLENALIAGKIISYAQGFAMIDAASDAYNWALPLPEIARVWRQGCIIRSSMLDDMATALDDHPDRNLMRAPIFADALKKNHDALRKTVSVGALHGIAMPALSSSVAYFDTMRTARGTANMIQGQRDFFGRHGFERLDGGENCHGPWTE